MASAQTIERTADEAEAFKRGLGAMGSLYASLSNTSVLQLKEVPEAPDGYSGEPFNRKR